LIEAVLRAVHELISWKNGDNDDQHIPLNRQQISVTHVKLSSCDHGFDKTSVAALRKRLTPLIGKTQPYAKKIAHKAIWVEPELLAEIEYRAKSAEGKL